MHKKITRTIQIISIFIIGFSGMFLLLNKIYLVGYANPENLMASVSNPTELQDNKIDSEIIKEIPKSEEVLKKESEREKKELANFSCPKAKRIYLDMSLLNVGQEIGLPDTTYVPNDLRELNTQSSTKKGICVRKATRDAFEQMVADAKIDGYKIKASSGFRSYNYQQGLLDARKKEGIDASKSIAKAGYSEHQLGVTLDLTGSSIKYTSTTTKFEGSVESKWLEDNAYKYGFVMSYPKDKSDITGYIYEPWHYRYVGVDMAQKIKDSGLTITEYLALPKTE